MTGQTESVEQRHVHGPGRVQTDRPAATIATAFAGRVQEVLRQDRLLSEIQSETRGRFRHLHRLRIHMGLGAQGVDVGEDARTIAYTLVAHPATQKPTIQRDGQFGRGWTLARQHTGRRCHPPTSQEREHGRHRHGIGTLRHPQQWRENRQSTLCETPFEKTSTSAAETRQEKERKQQLSQGPFESGEGIREGQGLSYRLPAQALDQNHP